MSEELVRKAYELGLLDGTRSERERVIALLADMRCPDGDDCFCGSWTESIENIAGSS